LKLYKILVATPTIDGRIDYRVDESFLKQFSWAAKTRSTIQRACTTCTLVFDARNHLAKIAVEGGYTHIFFQDSDVIIPENTLEKLVKADKPIITGIYYAKRFPNYWPVILKKLKDGLWEYYYEYPQDGIFEVDGAGMGCCLIKAEVLKKLGENPFNPIGDITGEDIAFCYRARMIGYKTYVDPSVQCGHITQYIVTKKDYEAALEHLRKTSPKVVDSEV
jgi:GT2 family glycosyltransferase